MVPHARGHIAEVGSEANLYTLGAKRKADRIDRIVRNREWHDLDIANAETATRGEVLRFGQIGSHPRAVTISELVIADGTFPRMMGRCRHKDWNIQFSGQPQQ